MGSVTHRLEVLFIGVILMLAGVVVVILMVVRQGVPSAYRQATPLPIATRGAAAPTNAAIVAPVPTTATVPATVPALAAHITPVLRASWPWLLLGAGIAGAVLVSRRRQLLAAADAETRLTNVRIMRNLAAHGLLTPDRSEATGIDRAPTARWRSWLRRPRLRLPPVRLPQVRFPRLRRPRLPTLRRLRPVRAITIDGDRRLADACLDHAPAMIVGTLDEHLCELPVTHPATVPTTPLAPSACTAEDRALAVAGALATIWTDMALQSPILALDTACASGDGTVVVTIDQHPAEEAPLTNLPDRISMVRPGWRASWRREGLVISVPNDGPPLVSGPLIAPILTYGRGNRMLRCFPLTSWRHLSLYGASALDALHALLGSLLYTQPPAHLALMILDHGEIRPLYRDVAHCVTPPGDAPTTLEQLARMLRGSVRLDVRPLLLVVVAPDADLLHTLTGVLARLRTQPTAPVHLLVSQERLQSAGRELYALLPALITAGGQGSATLLPGQNDWPRRGAARLVGRGMRLDGCPLTLDERAIAQMLAPLRGPIADLPPVLLDAPGPTSTPTPAEARNQGVIAPTQEAEPLPTIAAAMPSRSDSQPPDAQPASALANQPERDGAARLRSSRERANSAPVLPPAYTTAADRSNGAGTVIANLSPALAVPLAPMVEPENGWPIGPAPLGRGALAELLTRVVATSAVVGGQENERGLTKNRLVALLPDLEKAQARELAEVLMAWFDRAGLLVEPTKPDRLRHPRPLATTDLTAIADQLTGTAIPDRRTVVAMWADSYEGRT